MIAQMFSYMVRAPEVIDLYTKTGVYGHGTNDADYAIAHRVNGKQVLCPYYRKWSSMLKRCYDPIEHRNYPHYKDCTVCDEWHYFTVFKAWMENQDWRGKCLDKDILIPGNKHYSPDTCLFVTPTVNSLLTDSRSARGSCAQGVHYRKDNGKYAARIHRNGIREYLGQYETHDEAYSVFCSAKYDHMCHAAHNESEPIRSAILRHARRFLLLESPVEQLRLI